jgi:hypothetical protein
MVTVLKGQACSVMVVIYGSKFLQNNALYQFTKYSFLHHYCWAKILANL